MSKHLFITIPVPMPKLHKELSAFLKTQNKSAPAAAKKAAKKAVKKAAKKAVLEGVAAPTTATQIDLEECAKRTVAMLAQILNVDPSSIGPQDDLRGKYGFTDDTLASLRAPINGHWFHDVDCKITPAQLRACTTVVSLVMAIWNAIPAANKKP